MELIRVELSLPPPLGRSVLDDPYWAIRTGRSVLATSSGSPNILGDPYWPEVRPSSAILGRAWAMLGRLGAVLCHLGATLGPSWGHLGAVLGPSWGLLGAILALCFV